MIENIVEYFRVDYTTFLYYYIIWTSVSFVISLLGLRLYFSTRRFRNYKTIGFFHPFCNDGGGGERVLWKMVQTMRREKPEYYCVIYTGDVEVKGEEILAKVFNRFGIDLRNQHTHIQFCYLHTRHFVEASTYPHFTMLGQSFGAMILALEGLTQLNPDILIDSMGYSFIMPIFRFLGGCKVGCYVHYPTISTDMLHKVRSSQSPHPSPSSFLSSLKIHYYQLFSLLYGMMGKSSEMVWVNSSWTRNHINAIWNIPRRTFLLYPPCNIAQFSTFPLKGDHHALPSAHQRDRNLIISIAQFRPEKNHALQLRSLRYLLDHHNPDGALDHLKLVLIGSCRNAEDERRIQSLKQLALDLGLEKEVEFDINVSFEKLCEWMSRAQFGLHSMWCEHFGIGIVELMASGVIVIAHNSGGPKSDIVVPLDRQITGMLASTEEEYADSLSHLLHLPDDELEQIQLAAREHVKKFADEQFEISFFDTLSSLL